MQLMCCASDDGVEQKRRKTSNSNNQAARRQAGALRHHTCLRRDEGRCSRARDGLMRFAELVQQQQQRRVQQRQRVLQQQQQQQPHTLSLQHILQHCQPDENNNISIPAASRGSHASTRHTPTAAPPLQCISNNNSSNNSSNSSATTRSANSLAIRRNSKGHKYARRSRTAGQQRCMRDITCFCVQAGVSGGLRYRLTAHLATSTHPHTPTHTHPHTPTHTHPHTTTHNTVQAAIFTPPVDNVMSSRDLDCDVMKACDDVANPTVGDVRAAMHHLSIT